VICTSVFVVQDAAAAAAGCGMSSRAASLPADLAQVEDGVLVAAALAPVAAAAAAAAA
jgi:hypothetical protein